MENLQRRDFTKFLKTGNKGRWPIFTMCMWSIIYFLFNGDLVNAQNNDEKENYVHQTTTWIDQMKSHLLY